MKKGTSQRILEENLEMLIKASSWLKKSYGICQQKNLNSGERIPRSRFLSGCCEEFQFRIIGRRYRSI